jgi:GNAT superfamily N-acetyltransferase
VLIAIRSPQAGDEAEVADIERQALEDLRKVYRPTRDTEEQRASTAHRFQHLVATVDDRLVGIVHYYFTGDNLAFLGLGVHRECRRRGVARALVQELERIGETTGATALTLYTIRETGNVTVFESLGFSVESEQPTCLFESTSVGDLTEVHMRKRLQSRSRGGAA